MTADPTDAEKQQPRVVAIDGPAGSGKSTVAKALARRVGLDYLDTGAMYRAVAFAAIRRGIDPDDREPVARIAREMTLVVGESVTVDGVDATIEIRGPEVTRAVSTVAANPDVRVELRDRQRAWAREHKGGVIEGRDIGTVVFPDAVLKVYLTANDSERARRRHLEAAALHYDASSPALAVETVQAELARRDHLDSTRATSPLTAADDAIEIDTTGRTVDEVVDDLVSRLEPSAVPAVVRSESRGSVSRPEGLDAHGAWRPTTKGRAGQAFDRGLYRFCRAAVHGFSRAFWRLSIEGLENVPTSGPFVVAPVHRSNIDTPLIATITHRRLRFMGKDSLWKSRAAARFLSALGGFPVHRGSADRDALRRCIEVIHAGEPLVVFPEGTRQSGPIVQDLFEGAVYVAARTGVPIVPVGIGGSENAMPKGSKFLHPVRIAIVIGAPLPPPGTPERRATRREIKELTAQLHKEIQTLFDAARKRAGQTP